MFYPSSRQANLNYVSRNLREQTKNQNSQKQIQFQEQQKVFMKTFQLDQLKKMIIENQGQTNMARKSVIL